MIKLDDKFTRPPRISILLFYLEETLVRKQWRKTKVGAREMEMYLLSNGLVDSEVGGPLYLINTLIN
jgi:hypothetical protein